MKKTSVFLFGILLLASFAVAGEDEKNASLVNSTECQSAREEMESLKAQAAMNPAARMMLQGDVMRVKALMKVVCGE